MRKRLPPGLVLFLLAPAIGELLSSSSPPAEFFRPLGFAMLSVLYGGGALLARELVVRWGRSVPSLILLGAAYGIAEEGLMCKSFFDPNWMDVGLLGAYGRWLGVNWVWTFELTIYHAVFSILIPVTLVRLLYPDRRDEPWIGQRGLTIMAVLWFLNGVLIFFAISAYRPPWIHLAVSSVAVTGLCVVARQWPRITASAGQEGRAWRPWRLAVFTFLATVSFFALAWAVPQSGIHPWIVILLMLLLTAGVTRFAWRMSSRSGFADRHKLALVSGALGFFILIMAPIREWAPDQPDNPRGMALVGLMTLVFLFWLSRRIRRDAMSQLDSDAVSCHHPPAGSA